MKESVPCPSFTAFKRTQYLRELRCASKILCIVPFFAGRGLSSKWCVAPLEMNEGNSLGRGYNRPTGCSAEKAPHANFNFKFFYS